jgi:hypothetical protein
MPVVLHGLPFLVFLQYLPVTAAMKLDDLCEAMRTLHFPSLGEHEHPERETVRAARSRIQDAIINDDFLADCMALELRRLEGSGVRPGLAPFFVMPELGIRFAFGYWPPGGTPGPHEHTAWTVTAVCRNELEVLTYDRDASYARRELVPKNRFPASAGNVGYIHKPSIHAPINTSSSWSLSFHVTSPRDGECPGDQDDALPGLIPRAGRDRAGSDHPYAAVIAARRRKSRMRVIARTLGSMNVAQAPMLMARCAAVDASRDMNLQRVRPELALSYRCADGMVGLHAETPNGDVEEITVDAIARESIAFVTRERVFRVADLPGKLSHEERVMIADALVETGLYERRSHDARSAD